MLHRVIPLAPSAPAAPSAARRFVTAMPSSRRSRRAALLASAASLAAACSSADPVVAPTPSAGRVQGSVAVVGDPSPPGGLAGSRAYLLAGPEDRRTDAVRQVDLGGGPRLYTFAIDAVPPGRYYLEVCIELGSGAACSHYAHAVGQDPAPIDVRAGRVTELAVRF